MFLRNKWSLQSFLGGKVGIWDSLANLLFDVFSKQVSAMLIDYRAAIFEKIIKRFQHGILHNFSNYQNITHLCEIMVISKRILISQMSYLSSLWHYGSWEKIFHNFSSLRPIFGAPALAMTLKLTHDTNAMRQIIVKRDVGQRCKNIKVGHLSDWCEIFVCQPKLHISCLYFTRSSLKLHLNLLT